MALTVIFEFFTCYQSIFLLVTILFFMHLSVLPCSRTVLGFGVLGYMAKDPVILTRGSGRVDKKVFSKHILHG